MNLTDNLYLGCPVQHARQYLAGKWQMGILWSLRNQCLRFSEIKTQLPGISDKALMQELDYFVQKNMITRTAHDLPSPKTEYALSTTGQSLIPLIASIVEWGYSHLKEERVSREMSMTPFTVIHDLDSQSGQME